MVILQHAAGLVCIAHKCIIRMLDSVLKLLILKKQPFIVRKMDEGARKNSWLD